MFLKVYFYPEKFGSGIWHELMLKNANCFGNFFNLTI